MEVCRGWVGEIVKRLLISFQDVCIKVNERLSAVVVDQVIESRVGVYFQKPPAVVGIDDNI